MCIYLIYLYIKPFNHLSNLGVFLSISHGKGPQPSALLKKAATGVM